MYFCIIALLHVGSRSRSATEQRIMPNTIQEGYHVQHHFFEVENLGQHARNSAINEAPDNWAHDGGANTLPNYILSERTHLL